MGTIANIITNSSIGHYILFLEIVQHKIINPSISSSSDRSYHSFHQWALLGDIFSTIQLVH